MSRATCLAVLCALVAHAAASPRSDPTTGRAVFTGATSPNATSIDLNPAAIGLGIPDELYFAAMAVLDRYAITRRNLDIDTGAVSDGEAVNQHLVSPGGMVAGIWHTTEGRITLGFQLRSSPAERFIENQEALRYHTLGGSHRTFVGGVATSLRITKRFYFGISLATQTSFLRLRYARDTALEAGRDPARGVDSDCGGAPCGVENPQATERYDVDVQAPIFSTSNLTVNIGVVVRLARDVWLGVSYHTPPGLAIQNQLTGTMAVERAPRDGGGYVTGGSTVYLSQPASFDGELRARIVDALDLHVGGRFEHLERLQNYDVRGYGSAFPTAGIPERMPRPRGFDNSIAVWGGVEQVEIDASQPLRFGGRLGFETSSLDGDRTSPLTIAPTSFTADVGVQFHAGQLILEATYGLQYFPKVDVTDSAFDPRDRLACFDSGFDYSTDACAAVRHGYAIPTALGEYNRLQHAARLALRILL